MYIQLTTRCNMYCSHCCFSCGPKGRDISEADFSSALEIAKDIGTHVVLGGGEPTLHPQFVPFIQKAIWEIDTYNMGVPGVHIVTNGTHRSIAIRLAHLAQQGVISAALSQDSFHSRIDDTIVEAFGRPEQNFYSSCPDGDLRHINGEPRRIVSAGRAGDGECACGDLFVAPTGNVFPCGCKRGKIGHVSEGLQIYPEYMHGYCSVYQKKELREALEEVA